MTMAQHQRVLSAPRLAVLDLARTVALAAMVVFHGTYDLALFGLIDPATPYTGGWPVFARIIAGSFLFLAGISLWLAQGRGLRWHPFLRRLAMLIAAAVAVSVGTRLAVGDAWVRFGILHAIAASSVIGVLFLRLPVILVIAAAIAALAAPVFLTSPALAHPALLWLGLGEPVPPMVDHVPILPWVGPFLLGLAAARLAERAGLWHRLSRLTAPGWLLWPGRHSLAIYLIHQPVLFGAIWAAMRLAG
jgi:uncharacterized membrane protein